MERLSPAVETIQRKSRRDIVLLLSGRKELQIFFRQLYVRAIDAERGATLYSSVEKTRQNLSDKNFFCAPII
jgi:hypothetical protein